MRSAAALLLLVLAAPLVAQHSEENAKGGVYADRLKDEIRARKMYEKAAKAALPPHFREKLAKFQPGPNDLAAYWGEFVSYDGFQTGHLYPDNLNEYAAVYCRVINTLLEKHRKLHSFRANSHSA